MAARTSHPATKMPSGGCSRARGVALIVVLACLVLIGTLIIAFFSTAQLNLQSSKAYSDSQGVRALADTAVKAVMTQIRTATTEGVGTTGITWASQPGMIRTFNGAALSHVYKLYSSDTMVATTVTPADELKAISQWNTQPALFTDLNQPVIQSDGTYVYPILTPPASTASTPQGFSCDAVNNAPGYDANKHPLPMPAEWLYVLQDGTLAPASAPPGNTTTVNVPAATLTNPIVGRVAFWTDDESCKVNVNTASEGTYWDHPRFVTTAEINLAQYQPAHGEYQRFPGHPATVSLSTVLKAFNANLKAEDIYAMLPRVSGGGSLEGSTTPTTAVTPKAQRLFDNVDEFMFGPTMNTVNSPPTRAQQNFTEDQIAQARFYLTAHSRAPEVNLFGMPRISIWPVNVDLATNPNSPYTTANDRLMAFCSTIDSTPATGSSPQRYYFQRQLSWDPTNDYLQIPRNQQLYSYLDYLTSQTVPGLPGSVNGFATKFAADRHQILTEIFDYIRAANIYDDNLATPAYIAGSTPPAYVGPNYEPFYQFTAPRRLYNATSPTDNWPGHGQITPINITYKGDQTMGFGRFYTISEVGLLLICTADGNGLAPSAKGSANDARSASNLDTPSLLTDSGGNSLGTDYTSTGPKFPANPTLANTYGGALTKLSPGNVRLQAMLLLQPFSPMMGNESMLGNYQITVSGLENISLAGQNPFTTASDGTLSSPTSEYWIWRNRMFGGTKGINYPITLLKPGGLSNNRVNGWSHLGLPNAYPFVSQPFTVANAPAVGSYLGTITTDGTMSLSQSSPLTVKIYANPPVTPTNPTGTPVLVQTLNVQFPTTNVLIPTLLWCGTPTPGSSDPTATVNGLITTLANQWWGFDTRILGAGETVGSANSQTGGSIIRGDPREGNATSTVLPTTWQLNTSSAAWGSFYVDVARAFSGSTSNTDVVRSVTVANGDFRLSAAVPNVPATTFIESPNAFNYHDVSMPLNRLAHSFMNADSSNSYLGSSAINKLVPTETYWETSVPLSGGPTNSASPDVSAAVSLASNTGDFDNGLPAYSDGPYINKPDEGDTNQANGPPYFNQAPQGPGPAFFTPNRIISSPGTFGSLPTWVKRNKPWTTLLFRPDPTKTHPDSASGPADYLLMDLFNMPTAEPYAITEPFSTAGKVNMNYQILPYTYIDRNTALCAAMKALTIAAVPNAQGANYQYSHNGTYPCPNVRSSLNLSETNGTLRQFKTLFDTGDIFRSAAQICDMWLVPSGSIWNNDSDAMGFWLQNQLTGDNTRERPYSDLYGLLTTKSNTYQVHYRVQSLQPSINGVFNQWTENSSQITGEGRGSVTIERFLDPNDPAIPDYATLSLNPPAAVPPATSAPPLAASLEKFYRFRTVDASSFNP